jgi:hypothetical protein
VRIIRAKLKAERAPALGEIRVIYRRFLWLPKYINGEIRWLERASWSEKYISVGSYEYQVVKWMKLAWVDYSDDLNRGDDTRCGTTPLRELPCTCVEAKNDE